VHVVCLWYDDVPGCWTSHNTPPMMHPYDEIEPMLVLNGITAPPEKREVASAEEYAAAKQAHLTFRLDCVKVVAADIVCKGGLVAEETVDPLDVKMKSVPVLASFLAGSLRSFAAKLDAIPQKRRRLEMETMEGRDAEEGMMMKQVFAAGVHVKEDAPRQLLVTVASSLRGLCPEIVLEVFARACGLGLARHVKAVLDSEGWSTLGYTSTVTRKTVGDKYAGSLFAECFVERAVPYI
jgi:hypothetical protein